MFVILLYKPPKKKETKTKTEETVIYTPNLQRNKHDRHWKSHLYLHYNFENTQN